MRKTTQKLRSLSVATIVALMVAGFAPFLASSASATSAPKVIVHLDRIKTGIASTGWVCATASTVTAYTTFVVTFPATFTLAVAGSWASNNTANVAWPSGAAGLTSVTSTPASVSGQVVTWTVSQTPALATFYCLNWTAGLTNTGSAGASQSGTFSTSADTTAKGWSIAIVANDQIVLNNTTVPPIFSLTFGANTDGFASNILSSTNTRFDTTGVTLTLQTNAANGWTVWAQSGTSSGGKGALNSVLAGNYKITNPDALASAANAYGGTLEDYGLSSSISAGTGTADAAYIRGAGPNYGVLDAVNLRAIAGGTAATTNGTDSQILVKLHAAIQNSTPAATDYTDTITIVGAGIF